MIALLLLGHGTDHFYASMSSTSIDSPSLLSSVFPFLWKSSAFFSGLLVLLGGALYLKQESLLYFPEIGGLSRRPGGNPRGYRSPEERQVPFESHSIPCSDGVHIHAWLLFQTTDGTTPKPGVPTIVFFHGNAGNIGLRLPNAYRMLQQLQANILMVEYRGYGDSDVVSPTEAGLKLDAQAALHFCQQHPAISSIFLFGRSLGGAVALDLALYAQNNQIPLAGVIVENTFTSISAMVDCLLPWLTPVKAFVLKIGWKSEEIVPQLRFPLLYLAGARDELVPHAQMRQLYQLSRLSSLVKLYVIPNGTHNESWIQGGAAYWEAMKSFLLEALAGVEQRTETTANVEQGESGGSGIPTMSHRVVDLAREAITGTGVEQQTFKKEL